MTIQKLKSAVIEACQAGEDCFNELGCDFKKKQPEKNPKCFHLYCDKYKWIIDRAGEYSKFCDQPIEKVIEIWERKRNYDYMNYYQDCNFPFPFHKNVITYETFIERLTEAFGNDNKQWKFECPMCHGIQSPQDFIDNKIKEIDSVNFNCIGRYVKGKGCDWTLGGLFQINELTVIKDCQPHKSFKIAIPKD